MELGQIGIFDANEVELAFLRKDGRRAFVVALEADASASESLGKPGRRKQRERHRKPFHVIFSHHVRFS